MKYEDIEENFEEALSDVQSRSRVRTAHDPETFIRLYEAAPDAHKQGEVREVFRELDQGRFYDFLDEAHNVLAKSDLDRRHHFEANHSDHLILWIKAFGTVEDLNTFPRISHPHE